MDYHINHSNGYCIINIGNELSMLSTIDFVQDVVAETLQKGEKRIAVRFRNSSFLSSHSISVLIACNEMIRNAGGEMLIVGGGNELDEYLTTLGIRDRFTLCSEPEELVNHL